MKTFKVSHCEVSSFISHDCDSLTHAAVCFPVIDRPYSVAGVARNDSGSRWGGSNRGCLVPEGERCRGEGVVPGRFRGWCSMILLLPTFPTRDTKVEWVADSTCFSITSPCT